VDTEADPQRLIGVVLASRYRVESLLGHGAMGTVYRARHVKVGREFAIKILHPRLLADEKIRRRFAREAELAGALHHRNVVNVVDVGESADGLRYLVMEYAGGSTLYELIKGAGPMPSAQVTAIVRQLLAGLEHAHDRGLIHRDFKPENVIIERGHGVDLVKIVDFGVAILRDDAATPGNTRLTTAGLVLGTPLYMAPEQALGAPIDHRIDLFALGVMCFEMLTGMPPFDGDGVDVARANLLTDTPVMSVRVPGLQVDPLLEAFTRTLMMKSRDARPATAAAALALIDLIDRDRPAAAALLGVELDPYEPPQAAPFRVRIAMPEPAPSPVHAPIPEVTDERPAMSRLSGRRIASLAGLAALMALALGITLTVHAPVPAQPTPATGSPTPRALEQAPPRNVETAAAPPVDRSSGPSAAPATAPAIWASVTTPSRSRPTAADRRSRAQGGGDPDGSAGGAGVLPRGIDPPVVARASRGAGHALGTWSSTRRTPVPPALPAATPPAEVAPIAAIPDRPSPPAADPSAVTPPDLAPARSPSAPTLDIAEAAPPAVAAPAPPPASAIRVAELYATVGKQLKAFDQARGSAATADLWPLYLRIRINDVITDPVKRDEADALLHQLYDQIAVRSR
jgi:serine/threonine-protein kinase